MVETSIKDQLKKLIQLQSIDSEIYTFKQERDAKPAIIADLQEQFESSKARLTQLEEKLKGAQLSRKEKELSLKTKEEDVTKANTVLSELKTNKEYSAKISEIESIKADMSIIEENILKSYDESDKITKDIEEEKKNVAEKENVFQSQKKEVEDDIKEINDRLAVLESKRKQATEGIDPTYLSRYDRILAHKQGLALAPLSGNSCGGCYMNITSQQINALKMNDALVECEVCSRILYLEDNL